MMNDGYITEEEKRNLKPQAGQPTPRIFAQVKTHKEGEPLRLITSAKGGPAQKADWLLSKRLRKYIWGNHKLKNTDELLERLDQAVPTEQQRLFSLDVVNLFPSLRHQTIIKCFLKSAEKLDIPEKERDKDRALLRLILSGIYVSFGEHSFQQFEGTPMGYSSSPIMAEIVLQFLDEHLLTTHPNLLFYGRFVDDVGAAGTAEEAQSLLTTANQWDPDLSFTMEMEKEGELPFLDVLLTREEKRVSYVPYSKPMASDRGIDYTSAHPKKQLLAIATNTFRQIFRHTSDSRRAHYFINEAKDVFLKRRFPAHQLERCITKAKSQFRTAKRVLPQHDMNEDQFQAITFVEGASEPLSRILRERDIHTHYKLDKNIKKRIQKPNPRSQLGAAQSSNEQEDGAQHDDDINSQPVENATNSIRVVAHPYHTRSKDSTQECVQSEQAVPSHKTDNTRQGKRTETDERMLPTSPFVVYNIPCNECDASYVGETKRRAFIRVKEHIQATNREDPLNGVSAHVAETSHNIAWDQTSILVHSNSKSKTHLRTLEALAIKIQSLKRPLMNLAPPSYPEAQTLLHPSLALGLSSKWESSDTMAGRKDQWSHNRRAAFKNIADEHTKNLADEHKKNDVETSSNQISLA